LLQTVETFRHEAPLYAGEVDFLTGTLPFIREGMAAGEPVLVVVSAARIGEPIWAECTPDERGLWMVNQLCDLVQLRTLPAGAVVRLHLYVR
jgi:hypothetical protein